MLPSLFLSHGSPTLPLDDCPARTFLMQLGQTMPRPRAILVASAHWDTTIVAVNRVEINQTIHDFSGFPENLYRIRYTPYGTAQFSNLTQKLLEASGISCTVDEARGLDHGAWVPLLLSYPNADIPVFQLSIQTPLGPAHHLRLGRAIAALRAEDVLVIGSGSFTHNLRAMTRWQLDAPEPAWSQEFSDWIHSALIDGRTPDLLEYRSRAPHAVQAHPMDDHFMPLFVALGAGGENVKAQRLHRSSTFGSLRMDAYAFS